MEENPKKALDQTDGLPMSLAESCSRGRRITRIRIFFWPTLLIIIGVVGILFSIRILTASTGYVTTTEIMSVKWVTQTSNNTIQLDNEDIYYHLRNETSKSGKTRKKRMTINPAKSTEDIISNFKDTDYQKARDIIMKHEVPCNQENKNEICKDLVMKLQNTKSEKVLNLKTKYNVPQVQKIMPVNKSTNHVTILADNVDLKKSRSFKPTEITKRETLPTSSQPTMPRFIPNISVEPFGRDSYGNVYPNPNYPAHIWPQPQHQPPVPLADTCLLARLLQNNHPLLKGVLDGPSGDYSPLAYEQQSFPQYNNRYHPSFMPKPYYQSREVEAQNHKVHPQDVDILMNFLTPKKTNMIASSEKSFTSTREAQCPIGSLACDSGEDCIAQKQWCDGNVDCVDVSDEVRCNCQSRVDKSRLCDGYFDCPFGEDEMGCNGCSDNTFSCEDFDMNPRGTCFTKEQRCNNIADCPNHRDEFECNSLSPSLHKKPLFAISSTEGYLHRNFRGDWYAVCKNPYMWAHDACRRETGLIIRPPFIQVVQIDPTLKVNYLNTDPGGFLHTSHQCFNSSAIYVVCPDLLCGTRTLTTSQLLIENAALENRLFGRNKRFLLDSPYKIFYGSRKGRFANNSVIENAHLNKFRKYSINGINAESKNKFEEGRRKRAQSRVVGGKPSQPAAWPWMAAMYRNGMFHCGGVIITQSWVISAAHCVHEFWNHYYEIQVGMLRRFSFSPQEQNHRVSHIIVNQKYSKSDMKNDLSLLMVEAPIQFSRWVRPICLPGPDTAGAEWLWGPPPGTMCTAVGWGATVEHGLDPDHMREVEVPIWSSCKHEEDREGKEICAGPVEGGKDACQGDSGGPLMCRNPMNSQQWYVAGIVSHGDGCARKGEPGVYTRVSIFLKWIKQHISSKSLPTILPKQRCPGFKCISGIPKCLPDKRVCDKIIDCLNGEDEVNCKEMRNNQFSSRVYSETRDVKEPTEYQGKNTKEDNSSKNTKQTDKTVMENDFKYASTIELSISKSAENSESIKSLEEDQVTIDPHISILSRETENSIRGDMITLTSSSSEESQESMSSTLDTKDLSTNLDNSNKNDTNLEDKFSTTLSSDIISDTTTVNKLSVHTEVTTNTNPLTTVTESSTISDSDQNESKENNDRAKSLELNITNQRNDVESKSLIVELLPSMHSVDDIEKGLDNNHLDQQEKDKIMHFSDSDKSKKMLDFNDKTDIIHKIEDIVLSELHPAKIRKKHLTPKEFECRRITQTIPYKYRCDHKADCEDGTDELGCTCIDYLTTFDEKLLCDGFFDCADGLDEIDCYSCADDRFLCQKSLICLPEKYVCDGKSQCPHSEDELDCFALSNGKEITFEFDGRPRINLEGFLTQKRNKNWHVVCQDNLTTEQQEATATHICRYLGFSSANKYVVKNINIKEEYLFQPKTREQRSRRNTKEVPVHFAYRSDITDENEEARTIFIKDPQVIKEECVPNITKTCMALYVYCDHELFDNFISQDLYRREVDTVSEKTWPWIAKIYVEGDYKCTGVLINLSLVLVSHSCLWDSLLEQQHTTVVLGSHRTLSTTNGPYEQVRDVESKTELYHSKAILLHLKDPVEYSNMVKPMVIKSSHNSEENSLCVAIGQDENNSTKSINLKETNENCPSHNICFIRLSKSSICSKEVNLHRHWAGIISCHTEQGWHPTASFVDNRGECGLEDKIIATEIVNLKGDVRIAGKKKMFDPKKQEYNDNCDGIRCSRGRCINMLYVCNGVRDCEDGKDESEMGCKRKTQMCLEDPHHPGCECSSGQLRCHNGKCVSKELFNDGRDDCGDRTDEPDHLICSRYLARVMPSGLCDGVLNCADRSDEDPMFCKCNAKKTFRCGKTSEVDHCVAPDMVCDGVQDCPNGEDESTCIGLNAPYGTPSGTGQVIMRTHGVWHTKCYPSRNHTRTELEVICRELGFLSGHAKEVNSMEQVIPPLQNSVMVDQFNEVMLNNNTKIKLRNTQLPLAKAVVDETLENCHPVYIECL